MIQEVEMGEDGLQEHIHNNKGGYKLNYNAGYEPLVAYYFTIYLFLRFLI